MSLKRQVEYMQQFSTVISGGNYPIHCIFSFLFFFFYFFYFFQIFFLFFFQGFFSLFLPPVKLTLELALRVSQMPNL
ncbi:hypothetical protein BRADI_1g45642v3 [Brachypodium distachyon]|uniref:Uncharacterized protein n=1 Tax=Brachypodium distachyon TaxID=15368 RepID=A0A0Q3H7D7_BRADI|nr:hypothetical protein BRADI_1g45642v3 [Brachypodium distachyon]